jgi:hypothetical protein
VIVEDDEFRRLVLRRLGAIQQEQQKVRHDQHFLRRALAVVTVLLFLLALTLAVLVVIPGVQLGEL